MVAVDDLLRRYALSAGPEHNGDTVFVGAAYEGDGNATQSLISAIHISR